MAPLCLPGRCRAFDGTPQWTTGSAVSLFGAPPDAIEEIIEADEPTDEGRFGSEGRFGGEGLDIGEIMPPTVPAPRIRVERGRPSVSGGLSTEQVEQIIRRHSRGIQSCSERELENGTQPDGTIVFSFRIASTGRAVDGSAVVDTIRSPSITRCVLDEVERMQFDVPNTSGVDVVMPLVLRLDDDP